MRDLRTADFDFDLPESLIAAHPPPDRDGGRLMILSAEDGAVNHCRITDLAAALPEGAVLILNDTKVIKARLKGERPTGGAVEVLLVRPIDTAEDSCRFAVLMKANRPLKEGHEISVAGVTLRVLARRPRGEADVAIDRPLDAFMAHVHEHGLVPLPPYIRRDATEEDVHRYQTVYAAHDGSVAAPTAGLHFTEALLDGIAARGVAVAKVTLHVGPGTFRPVAASRLSEHRMDAEHYVLSEETVALIVRAKADGRPVVAVGTTATRALEGAFAAHGALVPGQGATELFITPGFRFRVVDGLLTNFHLPRSTLIALVSALAGRENVLRAYRTAIDMGYRFYSYGDAMLIPPRRR